MHFEGAVKTKLIFDRFKKDVTEFSTQEQEFLLTDQK